MSVNHAAALLLLAVAAIGGCAVTGEPQPPPGPAPGPAHDGLDAVLWLQTATEYAASARGVYAAATEAAERIARAAPDRANAKAMVLDIDETVLDNSRYQAQLVLDDATYGPETWDDWIARQDAAAVPGVVDFLRSSRALGFHVAFITNRRCRARPDAADPCPQIEDTLVNLRKVGIDTDSVTLYIRGDRPPEACRPLLTEDERESGTWSSDKTSRRACVALEHEIVLLFGDQLGDFVEIGEDDAGPSGRALAADYADYWGRTWFMLPNPTYGSWRPRDSAEKRARIRGLD